MQKEGTLHNKQSRGAGKRGKGNYLPAKVITNPAYMLFQDKILSHFGIKYASLRDFLTIYNHFVSTNSGIKPYAILQAYNKTDGAFRVLFLRLDSMKSKGLIKTSNRRYYPTDTAIQELNNLLKSA